MKTFYGALAALTVTTALGQAISAVPEEPLGAASVDVPAGPIWNNDDAKEKCPVACAAVSRRWNGSWTTVVSGVQSVCGCD